MENSLISKAHVPEQDRMKYDKPSYRRRIKELVGIPGHSVQNWREDFELNQKLQHQERYKTYTNMVNKVPIVAASSRTYLNFAANSEPHLMQSPMDEDGEVLKQIDEIIFKSPVCSWYYIIKEMAIAALYGFAVLEWSAMERSDGTFVLYKVEARPQSSIWGYSKNRRGDITGFYQQRYNWSTATVPGGVIGNPRMAKPVFQSNTTDGIYYYIPRWKCIHLVDRALMHTDEGVGIFRHIVEESYRYRTKIAVQDFAHKRDLRGILIFDAPLQALRDELADEYRSEGKTPEDVESDIRIEIQQRLKYQDDLARAFKDNDSSAYIRQDSAVQLAEDSQGGERPVSVKQFDVKLMEASLGPHESIEVSIGKSEYRIASVFGLEGKLLGETAHGTQALSKDKSNNFNIQIDSTLRMISHAVYQDLFIPFAILNGIDPEKLPKVMFEPVKAKDPERSAIVLEKLVKAGHRVKCTDPIFNDIRESDGRPPQSKEDQEELCKQEEEMQQAQMEGMKLGNEAQMMQNKEPNQGNRGGETKRRQRTESNTE